MTVSAVAARSSEYPSTDTRNSTSMRNVPPIARPTSRMAVLAAVNERMRSSFTGNMGDAVCISHHMKRGKLTAAAANRASTVPEVQPQESPCTSARVRQNRPTPEMAMPGMSMPPLLAWRTPRGTIQTQRATARMPIGTLTKKIQDHWP